MISKQTLKRGGTEEPEEFGNEVTWHLAIEISRRLWRFNIAQSQDYMIKFFVPPLTPFLRVSRVFVASRSAVPALTADR